MNHQNYPFPCTQYRNVGFALCARTKHCFYFVQYFGILSGNKFKLLLKKITHFLGSWESVSYGGVMTLQEFSHDHNFFVST